MIVSVPLLSVLLYKSARSEEPEISVEEQLFKSGTPDDVSDDLYLHGISSSSEDLCRAYALEQGLVRNMTAALDRLDSMDCPNLGKETGTLKKILIKVKAKKQLDIPVPSPSHSPAVHEHMSDPVNMYMLIKRLVTYWPKKVKSLRAVLGQMKRRSRF